MWALRETIDDLEEIENMAVELATLARAEIVRAYGGIFTVRYKTGVANVSSLRDPVSEIDRRVETLIRARLAERFPAHDIIGEEIEERPGRGRDYVWAVDPIDRTTNFVNGFPMFAASIGVLHRGLPVAGAVWCSVSHALRAGVYHASSRGKLRFQGDDVKLGRRAQRRWSAPWWRPGFWRWRASPRPTSGMWQVVSCWCKPGVVRSASTMAGVGRRWVVSGRLRWREMQLICVTGGGLLSLGPARAWRRCVTGRENLVGGFECRCV
jgi:hypothetical protein